jgi:cytochrome c oxidase cbb3-type subunit 3
MSESKNGPNEEKHHVYDDIIEHNNPMPRWWIWSFVICVIFAAFYYTKYELLKGPTLTQELSEDMKIIEQKRAKHAAVKSEITEEDLIAKTSNQNKQALGAEVYSARCAVCHGDNLEGKIGPNLTDATWKNGTGSLKDVFNLIREGVPANGMPPWKDILKEDEVYAVLGFIQSKKQN